MPVWRTEINVLYGSDKALRRLGFSDEEIKIVNGPKVSMPKFVDPRDSSARWDWLNGLSDEDSRAYNLQFLAYCLLGALARGDDPNSWGP